MDTEEKKLQLIKITIMIVFLGLGYFKVGEIIKLLEKIAGK